jgi:hypothetical protein
MCQFHALLKDIVPPVGDGLDTPQNHEAAQFELAPLQRIHKHQTIRWGNASESRAPHTVA